MNIDYSKITDSPEVIKLLKQRIEIENKIKAIDETALIKHELELLSLPDVSTRYLFKDKQPQIGDYISMYWEDGSDCECVYNGLDKSIKPLPIGWYYVDL